LPTSLGPTVDPVLQRIVERVIVLSPVRGHYI
jgi:hypothetical protein